MTVDQVSLSRETDNFVSKAPKFYPTKIPLGHWQLRHLITHAEPDLLYYVSRHDVYCLNTTRDLRTHITVLPFSARCSAVGFGYICVGGGDTNHLAIIRLDPNEARFAEFASSSPPNVKVEQMGSDIINSISIHKLEGNEERGIADDVVAVLTNNDKTVRIFSLTQHVQNAVLDLPFAVNHATISPDGRMLVAVGDYQQAYFYERVDMKPSPDFKSQKYASAHCMWELLNIVILHVPKPAVVAGYFTTAWSPSGKLCSVSSEMGYVTILDIEALKVTEDGEDAAVAVVPSTRPDTAIGPGGIRTTAFSPHPWDLFVWSEDQGRVVLADLRTGLYTRQVLYLDPEQEGLLHVEIEDHPVNPYGRSLDANLEAEFIRQYRRSHTADDDDHSSYLTSERRRIARAAMQLAESDEHLSSLTGQERQLIDALGTRQRDDSLSRSPAPRSIYYGAPSEFSTDSRRSAAAQSSLFSQDFPGLARNSESSASMGATPLSLSGSTSNYLRSRNNADSIANRPSGYYAPRRATSLLQASEDSESGAAASTSRSSVSSRHPPLPPHLRPSSTSFPDWARITDHNDNGANPEILERRRRAVLRARERNIATDRADRHHTLLNQRALSRGDIYDRSLGLRTAGLAVSWDGRKIWAACDVGIFEYEVNVKERMMRPAIEMK